MITLPLSDLKKRIQEQSSLSAEDIDAKIKDKLTQLSGLISEEGAAHIIANELGIKLDSAPPGEEKVSVKNVMPGMKNVSINGKVTQKYELREFNTNNRSGKVGSMLIADETGLIRIVFWNDQTKEFQNIKEGDVLSIENGYARENNGRKEIHLNDNSKLEINPAGVSIDEMKKPEATRKKLSELTETDDNVEILATIVQVFDIRFFEVDPETKKRVQLKEGKFYLGDKEVPNPEYAYVMNLFLDDGTDNVRTVLWKNQIQNLLELSDEEVVKFKDMPEGFNKFKTDLLGTMVRVIGRVNKNQNFDRIELVANLVFKDVKPEPEIKKLEEDTSKVENAVKDDELSIEDLELEEDKI